MKKPDAKNGFSLVEVLVALFVFALVSAAVTASLQGAVKASAQLDNEARWLQDLQTTHTLLSDDLQHVVLRPMRNGAGTRESALFEGANAETLLMFTRTGRPNPGGMEARSELQRITYVLRDGNLVRETLPHENPGPQMQPVARNMIFGLRSVQLDFHNRNQSLPVWIVPVTGPKTLPAHIKLTLVFQDGRELAQFFEVAA